MKTSISVPDALWSRIVRPGESPSQVVQEALRALAEARAGAANRVRANQATFVNRGSGYVDPDDEGVVELLEKLTSEARHLKGLGYAIGVDAARKVSWTVLDKLPPAADIRADLTGLRQGNTTLPEDLCQQIWQSIADFDDSAALDADGDPDPAPTLLLGISEGLEDVCHAVRQRLRQPASGAPSEIQANDRSGEPA